MSEKRPGPAPVDAVAGSWASEGLPLSVRKELLESELRRLGLRRAEAIPASAEDESPAPRVQQPQGPPAGAGNPGET